MEPSVNEEQDSEFMDRFVVEQSALYAFIRSLVPNHSDAEEIFQQVAMTLWRKRETFDPAIGSFRAWAIAIARNHIRNFHRREYRKDRVQVFSPDVLELVAERWQDFDELSDERQAALKTCLTKLGPSDRQILDEHYASNRRAPEIAAAENIPLRTYYRKIQKIRELLLHCISRTIESEGNLHGRS